MGLAIQNGTLYVRWRGDLRSIALADILDLADPQQAVRTRIQALRERGIEVHFHVISKSPLRVVARLQRADGEPPDQWWWHPRYPGDAPPFGAFAAEVLP